MTLALGPVLLVEDDNQLRSMTAMALEMSGYDVLTGGNQAVSRKLRQVTKSEFDRDHYTFREVYPIRTMIASITISFIPITIEIAPITTRSS